ncbi:MAG: lysophospholipase [Candidatus Accumulibacter sp.]|nr:lysophospholipase [Accumulibacter sp.]
MAMNAIDGMLAREFGQKTPLGAYLNELSDVVSDAALYLPFVWVTPFGWQVVGIIVFLAALLEMAGAIGPMVGARGNFFVNSYVKSRYLTHDPERRASFNADPLTSRSISVNSLLGLYEAAERVMADAKAITVPTQWLISGDDWVAHHWPQLAFFVRLGASAKEKHILPGFYHDTLARNTAPIPLPRRVTFCCASSPRRQRYPTCETSTDTAIRSRKPKISWYRILPCRPRGYTGAAIVSC